MSLFDRFKKKDRIPDVRPGRESVPPEEGLRQSIGRLSDFYDITIPDFPLEYLDVLEPLAIWNPDIKQALSIMVNLGNTGHEVEVEAKNLDVVVDRLNWLAANIYQTGGGMDGLVNHFLRQIPLMGALSGEWVIAERIEDGVKDVVIPPVRTIRFKFEDGEYKPYQYTGRGIENTFVALNPLTYSYIPIETNDGNPYGIPPFYAALKNIEIQIDMVGNLAYIIKKMGLMGFLDVAMKIPEQKPSESDAAYKQRLQGRLNAYAKAFASNFSKGVAVHYEDQELKHNNAGTTAAAGAKTVFQINEEQVCSGLDIPPSMMGRSYSTTETYASVDYNKLIKRIENYRRAVKRFIEKGYSLDLLLQSIDAEVSVHFNDNGDFQEGEKEETEGKRIENVLKKVEGGIIDDDTAARELGYEEATGERPGANDNDWFEVPEKRHNANSVRFEFDGKSGKYRHKPERIELKSLKDKRVQNYSEALRSMLETAESAAVDAAFEAAKKDYSNETEFAEAVYKAFSEALIEAVSYPGVDNLSDRFVENAWNAYRYDDTSFLQAGIKPSARLARQRGKFGIDISVVDGNALRYLRAIDRFYFGSGNYLANHKTVGPKFIKWLQSEYIEKGLDIKTDNEAQDQFYKEFKGLVKNTSWQKINQLVDTTMSRIQNMGQTLKLYETGFQSFRIVGPRTAPICDYCSNMVGRVFSVGKAATRLADIVEKGFEETDDLPPFLSNSYSADELKGMSDEDLQSAGFDSPPFHPECRHRKAAED